MIRKIDDRPMLIPDIFHRFPECRPQRGILHIGAHECEEGHLYRMIGFPDNRVLWVEANSHLVAKHNRPNYVHAVLSDVEGLAVNFGITNNGESSSILPLKEHLTEHPHIHVVETMQLTTTTLNALYDKLGLAHDAFDFINIDIQGAELAALKGATNILEHVRAIYTEVNEAELYEGCGLLPDLDAYLKSYGFDRVCTHMTPHRWGDALYMKK